MPRIVAILVLLSVSILAPAAPAQNATWLAGPLQATAPNGADGEVTASVMWDPDGAGPESEWLVVAGDFTSIGGVSASRVAARNPSTGQWEPLGTGFSLIAQSLMVYDGDLIAGGSFSGKIARWDGATWQTLGGGINGSVTCLTVYNADLIAGGAFSFAGGAPANHIAAWNGSTWAPLGSGTDQPVWALGFYNGSLIVGGQFSNAGGLPSGSIARWDGAWYALGSGTDRGVFALTLYNGDLVAGGNFTIAGGLPAAGAARWNGASWSAMGTPASGFDAIHCFGNNGSLIAGMSVFVSLGVWDGRFMRWTGSTWETVAAMDDEVLSITRLGTEQVLTGAFTQTNGNAANRLARWNGASWGTFGGGTVNGVLAMTNYLGMLVAGGDFQQPADPSGTAYEIVGWNGVSLSPFGSGMNAQVNALKSFKYSGPFGDFELVAGGYFTSAGGGAANRIARWDVNPINAFPPPAWQAMGAGFDGGVLAIERFSSTTYAGGLFTMSGATPVSHVARWNAASSVWEPLGSGMNGVVYALKEYNGFLYAGGQFTTAGGVATGGLARWNGSTWSQIGGFFGGTVYALEVHNGLLVMAGSFPGFGGSPNISSTNGTSYFNLGTGGTNAAVLSLRSNGTRLFVGGSFTTAGGVSANHVAYWDGIWHGVLGGTDDNVYALGDLNGEAQIGGVFTVVVDGSPLFSRGWARYSSTGAPWIATHPSSRSVVSGTEVALTSLPAADYGATVQWFRFDQPLSDGPTGNGSIVTGALGTTLTLTNVSTANAGLYKMVATNANGEVSSNVATLTVDGTTDTPPQGTLGASLFKAMGPNPSGGATRLWFALAREASVRMRVHDVNGRLLRSIDAGHLPAGRHQVIWDARAEDGQSVRAGLYFVGVEADGHSLGVRRLTILR